MLRPDPTELRRYSELEGRILLIGVGAAKCATSWMNSYLESMPEVAASPLKEVHFFDARFPKLAMGNADDLALKRLAFHMSQAGDGPENLRTRPTFQASLDRVQMIHDDDAYFGHFARMCGPRTRVLTDITPAYAVIGAEGFTWMKAFCAVQPVTLKLLYVMRDPVARLWSQIRHMAQLRPDRMPLGNWASALDNPVVMARGDYRRTVTQLERVFGPAAVVPLFYEDLFDGTALDRLCDALGLTVAPADRTRRENETAVRDPLPDAARHAFRQALAPQYEFCRARFGAAVPETWLA